MNHATRQLTLTLLLAVSIVAIGLTGCGAGQPASSGAVATVPSAAPVTLTPTAGRDGTQRAGEDIDDSGDEACIATPVDGYPSGYTVTLDGVVYGSAAIVLGRVQEILPCRDGFYPAVFAVERFIVPAHVRPEKATPGVSLPSPLEKEILIRLSRVAVNARQLDTGVRAVLTLSLPRPGKGFARPLWGSVDVWTIDNADQATFRRRDPDWLLDFPDEMPLSELISRIERVWDTKRQVMALEIATAEPSPTRQP